MEGETSASDFAVRCRATVVRLALYVRRRCLVLSRRIHLLLSFFETIQLLAVILDQDYPSGSALSGPLAQGLLIIGQPGVAAVAYGLSDLVCLGVTMGLMAGLLIALGYLFVVFWQLQEYEFQRILSGSSSIPLLEFVSFLITSLMLATDFAYLPILGYLNYNSLQAYWMYLLQAVFLAEVSVLVLCFSSSKLGSRNFAAISQPLFALYRKLTYWVFIFALHLFPYQEHHALHEASYLLTGGFWTYQLFFMIPYQQELKNQVELGEALMLVWAGIMLIVASVNGLRGPAFLVTHISTNIGVLGVVLLAAHAYKGHIQQKERISFRFELELRLRWHFQNYQREASQGRLKDSVKLSKELRQKLDTPAISELCQDAYNRYPTDHYVLMRLLEYFLILKEKNFVKSLLARLQSLQSNLLTHLDIACCECYSLAELTKTKSDSDAAQFLKNNTLLASVKRIDEEVTVLFLRLGDLFMMPTLETEETSTVLRRILIATEKAKEMYSQLYQFSGDSEEFTQQYISFAQFLRDTDKVGSLEARLKHITQAKRSKTHLHDDSVFYQDDQNCALVISLDKKSVGKILTCRGAHHLGYVESELLDGSCLTLIPAIFAAGHAELFKSVHQYRHSSSIYEGHQFVYVVAKDGHLRRVAWRIKLINYELGKLGALVAFKPVPDGVEMATIENACVSQCTEAFSLVLKASHSQPILEAKVRELEVWEDGWSLLRCRGVFGYVDFKARLWRFISPKLYPVVVMETLSMMPLQAIPSANKAVLFDFPEQVTSIKEGKQQTRPMPATHSKTDLTSVKCLLKGYCVLSLASFLASILAQVGIIIAIQAQQADLNLDLSFMGLLSDLRAQALLAAVDVSELHYLKEVPRERSEADLKTDMLNRASYLEILSEDLLKLARDESPELTLPTIVWWDVIGEKIIFSEKNSIEVAEMIAFALRKSADSGHPDSGTVHSLLRNTPADAQSSLSALVNARLDYHYANNVSDRNALVTPLLALYSCLAVLMVVGLSWFSMLLSRKRTLLWKQANSLDYSIITAYGAWVRQRLEEVHNLEAVQGKAKSDRVLRYGLHSRILSLWVCLAVTVSVSVGLFVASYEAAFMEMQDAQFNQPPIFYMTGLQQTLLANIIFWQRELTLPASFQTASLHPLNTQPASPLHSLFAYFDDLVESQLALRSNYSSDLDISESHFQFLYGTQTSTVLELSRGYNPALSHLKAMVCDCLSTHANSDICRSADTLAFALLNSTKTNQSYYRSLGDDIMLRGVSMAVQLIAITVAVGVVYLLGIVVPVCVSVGKLVESEAELVPLVLKIGGRDLGTRVGMTTMKLSLP